MSDSSDVNRGFSASSAVFKTDLYEIRSKRSLLPRLVAMVM